MRGVTPVLSAASISIPAAKFLATGTDLVLMNQLSEISLDIVFFRAVYNTLG